MHNTHTSARPARETMLGISLACACALSAACSSEPDTTAAASTPFTAELTETPPPAPPAPVNSVEADAGPRADATTPSAPGPQTPKPIDVSAVMAMLATCNEISNGKYKNNSADSTATVPICGLGDAVFWKADMDIDCDGKESAVCNSTTDPWFANATSATDSKGDPLDSATLPFVVIPLKSSRFDYTQHGIELGTVVMVIYKGKIEYGVFGDQGPSAIIGEASYAMAQRLGINPDPKVGGVGSGVTYIAFTGASGVVTKMEDHDEAVRIGEERARQLLLTK